MGWWGKIVGGAVGFMAGGPIGAVLGAALGHRLDKGVERGEGGFSEVNFGGSSQERIQSVFFTTTFSVMGRIAKADGRVSKAEIDHATRVMERMELTPEMRKTAMNLFEEGKKEDFPLDSVIGQFRKECQRRRNLMQMFLEIEFQAAYADGELSESEAVLLRRIGEMLGFSAIELQAIGNRAKVGSGNFRGRAGAGSRQSSQSQLEDAYTLLGLPQTASFAEVKKSYRRLMSQHHPDKLVSKGLPEEMIRVAQEKTAEIRKAYEVIKERQ